MWWNLYCICTRTCILFTVVGVGLRIEHRSAHGNEHAEHSAAEERRVARSLRHGAQLRARQLLVGSAPLRPRVSGPRAGAHHSQSVHRHKNTVRQHQSANVTTATLPFNNSSILSSAFIFFSLAVSSMPLYYYAPLIEMYTLITNCFIDNCSAIVNFIVLKEN